MPHDPTSDAPVLGIALSTMDGRLAQNQGLVAQIAKLKAHVVVVNQLRTDEGRLSLDSLGWSKTMPRSSHGMDTLGLSLSRNAAIDALRSQWALLADDDITLDIEAFSSLSQRLSDADDWDRVGALSTRLMKDPDTPWRNDVQDLSVLEGRRLPNLRRIQRINSMELVLNVAALRRWDIRFDTRFGLGAPPTNGGEEAMLMDSILRRGGRIVPVELAPRLHPEESSGQAINPATAFTQGAVHRLVFGPADGPRCSWCMPSKGFARANGTLWRITPRVGSGLLAKPESRPAQAVRPHCANWPFPCRPTPVRTRRGLRGDLVHPARGVGKGARLRGFGHERDPMSGRLDLLLVGRHHVLPRRVG